MNLLVDVGCSSKVLFSSDTDINGKNKKELLFSLIDLNKAIYNKNTRNNNNKELLLSIKKVLSHFNFK